MSLQSFFNKTNLRLTKQANGYYINELIADCSNNSYSYYAANHFLLTSGLVFATGHFARAKYKVVDKETGEEKIDHPLIDLLSNPNKFHTQIDLMQSIYMARMVYGCAVVRRKAVIGFRDTDLIVLNNNDLEFPENLTEDDWLNDSSELKLKYGDKGEEIPLDELIFFYDQPAGMNDNETIEPISRLKAVMETLHNSHKAQLAKGIIIETNGKELISSKGSNDIPFSAKEKSAVELKLQSLYGMGHGRTRALVTTAAVDHKSLHIPVRDLGLDEAMIADATIIFGMLSIPTDVYNFGNIKSAYKNYDEALIGYYQGNLQTVVTDICMSFNNTSLVGEGLELRGDFNHLPVMASRNKKKFEVLFLQGKAMQQFLDNGFKWGDALKLCEFENPIQYTREIPSNDDGNVNQNS